MDRDELQEAVPQDLQPSPPLREILREYHVPKASVFTDFPLQVVRNVRGGERILMPTIVSFQGSYAFRFQEDGSRGEGQVYNTNTHRWEEPDVGEKE